MTMKGRALLVGIVMLAEMGLVGCGHYNCGATFGASSCSSGSGGLNSGNGNTPAGTFVYIADAGGIQGEVVDPTTKKISTIPGGTANVNTNVPGDWMVTAQQKFLYSGYQSMGEIYGWAVSGSGTLTAITGMGPLIASYLINNTSAGAQAIVTNPAGTLLFALDQGTDQINAYQIGTSGTLASPTITQLPAGFTPGNLAIDGQGKFLYVSNVVGLATTEVAVYSINSTSGALTPQGNPAALNLTQMEGESSGKFMIGTSGTLFASGGGGGNLYVASIDPSTGALTATQAIATGQPIDVVVQPNAGGTLVYTVDAPTSGLNGQVEGFTLNLSTGALTAIQGVSVTATGFMGEFDLSGKYLYVASNPSEPHIGLNVYDVSADTTLAAPLAGVAWSQGAWVPFDTP